MRKWLALAVNIESVKKLPNEGIHRSAIFLEAVPNVSAAQVAEVSPKQPDMEATAAISLLR